MRKKYPEPDKHAYYEIMPEGINYYCYTSECLGNPPLKEIDRMPRLHSLSYVPILYCSECGKTYFGVETRDHEAEQEITQYAEEKKRAEEERTRLAEQDNAESIAEFERLEAEQEQAIQEEADRHSAEENGDIILPNILTL